MQGTAPSVTGAPVAAGLSRRVFIGAAGTAGVLAAAGRVLPAASAATPAHCFFGSNQDVFLDIKRGEVIQGTNPPRHSPPVPGLRGVRIYGGKPGKNGNNLSHHWPQGPSPSDQGPIVYSIYPIPDTVINPKNPAHSETMTAIEKLIETAPPASYLNAWHEALSLKGSTPPSVTPAVMKSLHTVLNNMCRASAKVTYGSIFGGDANFLVNPGTSAPAACPPKSSAPHVWDSVPDDLGFYGVDVYGGDDIDKNMCFLDTLISNAKLKAVSGYPKIIIAETNNRSTDANRVEWFDQVAQRMHQYGSNAVGILTFWGGVHARLSGAWDPKDDAVIRGMNHVINKILV